ncbi:MAG TPA: alpha/beta hydrolase [Alphaproteobacteria bacterium]|nr:alpha/beta hydrolase [Alphaproteobacteria bacterium]
MELREFDLPFEGTQIHCWQGGRGFPLLLMHGSGPGVSTVGNWRNVLAPLAERFSILAFDLIGFGLSGRKPAEPYFDLGLWQRQARHMAERLGPGPIGIIAHSLSAAIALRVAAETPQIARLLLTGPMGTPFELTRELAAAWTTPTTGAELRAIFEPAVYDRTAITDEFVANRLQILAKDGYGAYFARMFGGEKQRYVDASVVAPETLARVRAEVLILHGRNDTMVPLEVSTLVLAAHLPQADFAAFARCGHGVAQEQPKKFVHAAEAFFG